MLNKQKMQKILELITGLDPDQYLDLQTCLTTHHTLNAFQFWVNNRIANQSKTVNCENRHKHEPNSFGYCVICGASVKSQNQSEEVEN